MLFKEREMMSLKKFGRRRKVIKQKIKEMTTNHLREISNVDRKFIQFTQIKTTTIQQHNNWKNNCEVRKTKKH